MTESEQAESDFAAEQAESECTADSVCTTVLSRTYTELPFREREILRYAGVHRSAAADPGAADEVADLLRACVEEARDALTYKVCYRVLPV